MSIVKKEYNLGEMRTRAQKLVAKMPVAQAAKILNAESNICVYAVKNKIFASFFEGEKSEKVLQVYGM